MVIPMTVEAVPTSVFVVHCEPTNATPLMFQKLRDMVILADQHSVPMTILMSSQWAQMVIQDPTRQSMVEDWAANGHEIGCHHHPYWITKTRPATWDGYTNTYYDELELLDQPLYLGNMDSFWEPFSHLSAEINTACMGGEEEDEEDWFSELCYSTQGNAIDDAETVPTLVDLGGLQAWQIGHCFLYGTDSALLKPLYAAATGDSIFGVNAHVFNYDDASWPVESWFDFLYVQDPSGASWKTVSDAITEFLAVDEDAADPYGLILEVYPNTPAISYTLPAGGQVNLSVYDASGRLRSILVDGFQSSGTHSATWCGADCGVYFVRLKKEGSVLTRKLVLLDIR